MTLCLVKSEEKMSAIPLHFLIKITHYFVFCLLISVHSFQFLFFDCNTFSFSPFEMSDFRLRVKGLSSVLRIEYFVSLNVYSSDYSSEYSSDHCNQVIFYSIFKVYQCVYWCGIIFVSKLNVKHEDVNFHSWGPVPISFIYYALLDWISSLWKSLT